jgi:hypothetical protein
LRAFFREFLELFFPEVAARLDFARVVFLDKEVFTDVPEGSRRELDLVAQAYTGWHPEADLATHQAELDALLERVLQATKLIDMGL